MGNPSSVLRFTDRAVMPRPAAVFDADLAGTPDGVIEPAPSSSVTTSTAERDITVHLSRLKAFSAPARETRNLQALLLAAVAAAAALIGFAIGGLR